MLKPMNFANVLDDESSQLSRGSGQGSVTRGDQPEGTLCLPPLWPVYYSVLLLDGELGGTSSYQSSRTTLVLSFSS